MAALQNGDRVGGRFLVGQKAGRGGMGVVYRAWDEQSNRPIAIKTLVDDALSQRFEREIAILETVKHPGTARYLAHGTLPDGKPFLALEWIEGPTLISYVRSSSLGLRSTAQLGLVLAGALKEFHGNGLIHRDIKPSNVLLEDGDPSRPKLIDFGIARAAQFQALTRTGELVGTPGYMSPEQARGQGDVGAESDIFSLGCLLYFCVAGRPPFAGTNPEAILSKIVLMAPTRLTTFSVAIPPRMERLIGEMMAKRPDERPTLEHVSFELAILVDELAELTPSPPQVEVVEVEEPTTEIGHFGTVLMDRRTTNGMEDELEEVTREWTDWRITPLATGQVLMVRTGCPNVEEALHAVIGAARQLRQRSPGARLVISVSAANPKLADTLDVVTAATVVDRVGIPPQVNPERVVDTDPATGQLLRQYGFEVFGEPPLRVLLPADKTEVVGASGETRND